MPVKGKSKVTDRQRAQIAARKIAENHTAASLTETGLAKTTVDYQATDPAVLDANAALEAPRRREARTGEESGAR